MTLQPSDKSEQEAALQIRPQWGRILVWVGLVVFLIILGLGLLRTQQGGIGIGDRVPNFTLTTFDGQEIQLEDLQGKVVVINFWASWCKPCEQEAAELEAAWRYYEPGGKVAFLGVAYVDTESEAQAYLQTFEITYPNGLDLGTRISQAFRISGVPETYIIDTNNVLQFVQIGPFQSISEIRSIVDTYLEP